MAQILVWLLVIRGSLLCLFAGCLCDGRREDPGVGRPRLQRNGHPSGQAGPVHCLRGNAAAAVPPRPAGCGH